MHDWILTVLDDVACFARANAYETLAEEVARCAEIARTELAAAPMDDPDTRQTTEQILMAAQPPFGSVRAR